jgi:hypothetical protein
MAFSDTLKEILDQGLAASKGFAVKAGGKAQDWSAKGVEASKDFVSKAGAKIQELGEKGVLTLEIKRLEGHARKLIAFLGAEIYRRHEQNIAFDAGEPEIKDILDKIACLKETIDQREEELKAIGKN